MLYNRWKSLPARALKLWTTIKTMQYTHMYLWLAEASEAADRTWICWKPAPGCCKYCMYSMTKVVLNSKCHGSSQRSWRSWSSVNELPLSCFPPTAVVALSTLSERLLCMLVPEPCLERCQHHTTFKYTCGMLKSVVYSQVPIQYTWFYCNNSKVTVSRGPKCSLEVWINK